jgi:hypothetical protein
MNASPSIFKRTLIISGLALLHLLVCWGVFLLALMNTSSRFQSGKPPNLLETLLQNLSATLMFPYLLLTEYGPGWFNVMLGIIPIVLTSLLWGIALYSAAVGWKRVRPLLARSRGASGAAGS